MPTLHLEIVTPEALAYQAEVEGVIVPGVDGELGILPQHVGLMTQIVPGELRIQQGGKELRMAVGEGFLEVRPDRVSIMTEMAIDEADIDEHAAEKAVALAEKELKDQTLSHEEVALVQSSLLHSLAKLRVKRRHHH
ncbi:MAG: ATP synthase F1 subunit epsilon [Verrucomicrobia bacterium]|jgi:F-type H+-transporting ATPase subunit epsilon|nr:MAG: ATP synthase F1 subunit epsilon [Verrucomicrobiota bacterium]MDH4470232.1 ATP synthase F1 subunit epsilon [Verrucomicrobiae bacterium]